MRNLVLFVSLIICPLSWASPTVRIVTEDWPPYSYVNDEGRIVGSVTERVEHILQKANIDFQINLYPWARAYDLAMTQPNVPIYSIFFTPERAKKLHFLCPLTQPVDVYLFKLAGRDDIQLDNLQDAKRYQTGLIRDDFDHENFVNLGFRENLHIFPTADTEANIRKLLHGRIDLMVDSKETMTIELEKMGRSTADVEIELKLSGDEGITNCMAFSKETDPHIIEAVRQALAEVNQSEPELIPVIN